MIEDNDYSEPEKYIESQISVIQRKNEGITILQKLIHSYLTYDRCLYCCVLDKEDDRERVLKELKDFIELPGNLMMFDCPSGFSDYWAQNDLGRGAEQVVVFISPNAGNCGTSSLLDGLGLRENRDYFNMNKLISALS